METLLIHWNLAINFNRMGYRKAAQIHLDKAIDLAKKDDYLMQIMKEKNRLLEV